MRTTALAIATSLTLVLAACGGEDDTQSAETPATQTDAEESPEEDASEDTTEAVAPTAAEETEAVEDEDAEEPTEDETEDETRDTEASETSPRGNVIKDIGETASVATEGGEGDLLVEFAITDIEVDAECTDEYASEPENGHFIVISIEATTMPELGEQDWPTSWDFSSYDFQIFDADGKRENDSTGNAYSCISSSESLPYDIGPGQTVEGKVALDSAHTEGVLVYAPSFLGAGWEWEFGTE